MKIAQTGEGSKLVYKTQGQGQESSLQRFCFSLHEKENKQTKHNVIATRHSRRGTVFCAATVELNSNFSCINVEAM